MYRLVIYTEIGQQSVVNCKMPKLVFQRSSISRSVNDLRAGNANPFQRCLHSGQMCKISESDNLFVLWNLIHFVLDWRE